MAEETSTKKKKRSNLRRVVKKRRPPEPVDLPFDIPEEQAKPRRRKVKRKKVRVSSQSVQEQEANNDKAVAKALAGLTMRGRAYRLSFGTLGAKRALNDREREASLKSDDDAILAQKRLYMDRDPQLLAVNQEQARVRTYFNMMTIAHPDKGTRLFVVRNPPNGDWDSLSQEEAETEMARQLDLFHREMNEQIAMYTDGPVQSFIDNYDEVLERAKDSLKDLYDPQQYMKKDELSKALYVKFHPIPSVLPPEYTKIDPAMRLRVSEYIREQLESSLAMQLEHVESTLNESLNGLAERIKSIGSDDKSRFYGSRIDNVVEAIGEYEKTMQAMGIGTGVSLGQNLDKLRNSLKSAGTDSRKVIDTLRSHEGTRTDVMQHLRASIREVGSVVSPIRRRMIR